MDTCGRQPDGTFAKGNSGGPGRPRRETEREYLTALVGRVTLDDWCAIADKAVAEAKAGDRAAREWLSRWLLPADLSALPASLPEPLTALETFCRAARAANPELDLAGALIAAAQTARERDGLIEEARKALDLVERQQRRGRGQAPALAS